MDITSINAIADQAVTYLAPLVPILAATGEGVCNALGEALFHKTVKIWDSLKARLTGDAAGTVKAFGKHPEDSDFQQEFRNLLARRMENDQELLQMLTEMVADPDFKAAHTKLSNNTQSITSGDNSKNANNIGNGNTFNF
ncbi:MAG: hypothetical protein AB7E32_12035 [Desulfovibrio sp.]